MKNINVETLHDWIKSGKVVLVDVREPVEHKETAIPGALSLPLGALHVSQIHNPSGKKVVVYCRSGSRSAAACQSLLASGFDNDIYNLEGGIVSWQRAGYDIAGKSCVSITRQVHMLIGLFVLIGTALGIKFHPYFFALPFLAGGGLLFSGITGWCGMAILLSKLPCNKNR